MAESPSAIFKQIIKIANEIQNQNEQQNDSATERT